MNTDLYNKLQKEFGANIAQRLMTPSHERVVADNKRMRTVLQAVADGPYCDEVKQLGQECLAVNAWTDDKVLIW